MKSLFFVPFVGAIVLFANTAHADCLDIIAFSKVVTDTIQTSSQVDAYARTFCSTYSSTSTSSGSTDFDVAFRFLSSTLGQSSASKAQVASQYCDATNQNSAKANVYRQYVEIIAPGAYEAYLRCEDLKRSGITIAVDKKTVLPKYFAISVSFKSDDALAKQIIAHAASPDVKCDWRNAAGAKTEILSNKSDILECTRKSSDEKSAVHIVPLTKPGSQLSFAWDRYQNGISVDTLKQLSKQVNIATADLAQVTQSMQSSVVAFALSECPDGWVEYQDAYGVFIRGVDKGNEKRDPDGQRTVARYQADTLQEHNHFSLYALNPGSLPAIGYAGASSINSSTLKTNGVNGARHSSETRPKNISLLYCKRK